MRFFKFLLFLIVIVGIVGGALYANQMGMNWSQLPMLLSNMGGGGANQHQQHSNMDMGEQRMASSFNVLASQNRDKLIQATTILGQSMDVISTDPYSQITIPNKTAELNRETSQTSNINVMPKDGVTINVNPNGSAQQKNTDLSSANIVFDQSKLEQLHNGIFKFSQTMMVINELNNDLADQSMMTENNPPNEQTYIIRYNLTLQNRNKINQANRLFQEAMVLINVNPYAPAGGYVYNTQKMQQLHQSISDLGKSSLILSRLSEDFNQQMLQIVAESRMARTQSVQSMQGMQGMQIIQNSNNTWIMNLGMMIIVLTIVLGILILIKRLLNEFRISR